MSERYSHRNGETEPPELDGWYFYCWRNEHGEMWNYGLVDVHSHDGDDEWYSYEMNGRDFNYKADGQWWGPVVPPWEDS